MKYLIQSCGAVLAACAVSSASAGVTAVLTGPSFVDAGQMATFTAHVTLTPLTGYDVFAMTGLDYQFDSGDGTLWMGVLANSELVGGSLKSYDFTASFLYNTPGTYVPTFSVRSYTTEFETDYVTNRYFQNSGYHYQTTYGCGFLNTSICYRDNFVDTSRWIETGNTPHNDLYQVVSSAGDATSITVNVPEPQTYALMLAGLVAIGSVARRRKAK